jgi:hypothetical protein
MALVKLAMQELQALGVEVVVHITASVVPVDLGSSSCVTEKTAASPCLFKLQA